MCMYMLFSVSVIVSIAIILNRYIHAIHIQCIISIEQIVSHFNEWLLLCMCVRVCVFCHGKSSCFIRFISGYMHEFSFTAEWIFLFFYFPITPGLF